MAYFWYNYLFEDDEERIRLLLLKKKLQIRTRNDLNVGSLVSPEQSPWSRVWSHGDEESFINITGIGRQAFIDLRREFRKHYRIFSGTRKGGRPARIDSTQALGLILQYYCSSGELKDIALQHGLRKNTASRLIIKVEKA
jgi:hypothetical protein